MYTIDQIVLTPHGKAKIIKIDGHGQSVRVEHLEATIAITDYRFADLKEC